MKPKLAIVADTPIDPAPETVPREFVPQLAETEALVRRLNMRIAAAGRLLAKERGVTFIRFEHLKNEFGQ